MTFQKGLDMLEKGYNGEELTKTRHDPCIHRKKNAFFYLVTDFDSRMEASYKQF